MCFFVAGNVVWLKKTCGMFLKPGLFSWTLVFYKAQAAKAFTWKFFFSVDFFEADNLHNWNIFWKHPLTGEHIAKCPKPTLRTWGNQSPRTGKNTLRTFLQPCVLELGLWMPIEIWRQQISRYDAWTRKGLLALSLRLSASAIITCVSLTWCDERPTDKCCPRHDRQLQWNCMKLSSPLHPAHPHPIPFSMQYMICHHACMLLSPTAPHPHPTVVNTSTVVKIHVTEHGALKHVMVI